MNVAELRIGNLYESVKFKMAVSCTLSDMYELCVQSDGSYDDPPIKNMFRPIPLSVDWLFELGFRESKTNGMMYRGKIMLFKGRGQWKVVHHDVAVKYVHQLQNLYYDLTGKKLK